MKQNNPVQVYQELNKLDYHKAYVRLEKEYPKKMVKRMQREGLRFLALCATQKKSMSPSKLPDEWWHAMILDTKQYAGPVTKICRKFIHHNPTDAKPKTNKELGKAFWDTIQAYENHFGEPDLELWGLEKKAQQKTKEAKRK